MQISLHVVTPIGFSSLLCQSPDHISSKLPIHICRCLYTWFPPIGVSSLLWQSISLSKIPIDTYMQHCIIVYELTPKGISQPDISWSKSSIHICSSILLITYPHQYISYNRQGFLSLLCCTWFTSESVINGITFNKITFVTNTLKRRTT